MTNEELKDLFVDYAERNPNVTVGELCSDLDTHTEDRIILIGDLIILQQENRYRCINKSNNLLDVNPNGVESWLLFERGAIKGYTNRWTESKIAILKLLTEGKEDLI